MDSKNLLSYEVDYAFSAPYASDFCNAKKNYKGVLPSVSKNNIQTFPGSLIDLNNYLRFNAFKNNATFSPPIKEQDGSCMRSDLSGLVNHRQGHPTRGMKVELPEVSLPMINALGRKVLYTEPGVDAKRMAMDEFEINNARKYKSTRA